MPIDPKSVKWDAPDPASIKWDEPEGFAQKLGRQVLNAGAGALRGAGSIGATILTPYDMLAGNTKSIGNPERRQAMTDALQTMGADTDSLAFQGGKLGGEIAGTLGAGGVLARGAAMLPGAARMAPVIDAIGSAGFKAGSATGLGGLAARTAGGAITGGASAGLVDPEQAGMGALIGGALPGVAQGAGMLGRKVGETIRGPAQSADMAQAIQQARGAGYVIPPTQASPTLGNRIMEGLSGKITTAQNASAKNQATTGRLAAEALGLPGDAKLTTDVLDGIRAEAGKAYRAVSELGVFDATGANLPKSVKTTKVAADNLMGKPATVSVEAGEVVRAWRQANADATAWFRAYGRDANPESLTKAKAAAAEAKRLDEFMVGKIEATQQGAPGKLISALGTGQIDQKTFFLELMRIAQQGDLAQKLKEARTLIAKTHSVEGAMNPVTGAIDARKLAKQLEKGKPLSGQLKTAAEFAAQFPKAAQTVEGMGSLPQTSPLDWIPAGALSMATSNPLMMLGVGARPAARALTLSPMVQNRLIQGQTPNALQALMANPDLAQLGYRAAPNALNGR